MSVRGLRQRKKKRKNTIVPSNQGRHPLRGFSFVVFTNMRYTETFHRLDVPNYPARCLWIAFRLVIQHALLAKHLVTERYIGTTRKCRQIYRLLPFFFLENNCPCLLYRPVSVKVGQTLKYPCSTTLLFSYTNHNVTR